MQRVFVAGATGTWHWPRAIEFLIGFGLISGIW